MIRTVIENILLFLLPTLIWLGWVLFQRARAAQAEDDEASSPSPFAAVLDDAPLMWLFATGAILVIVTLTVFGSSSGGRPGQHYEPSVLKDGKIQPSHID
ncbi:MAG: DUF6111 family protein [Hyphomicrobium sp.]|uniref:DUF6111 family protein n=1 Tax=Hyphomicrobium sp. TaxID=82 RepID=UPI003D1069AF